MQGSRIKAGHGSGVPVDECGVERTVVAPKQSAYERAMDAFASPCRLSRGLAGPRGSISPVAAQRSEQEAIELASRPIREHVNSMREQRVQQIETQLENLRASEKAGVQAAELASEGKRGWLMTSAATWGVALALTVATGGIAIPMLVLTSVRLVIAIGDVYSAEKDLDAARRIANGEPGVKRLPMGANWVGNLICSAFCPNPTDRQKCYVIGVVMAFRACLGISMIAVAGFIKVPAMLLEKGVRAAASVVNLGNEVHDKRTSDGQFAAKERKADALLALEAIRLSYLAQVTARIDELETTQADVGPMALTLGDLQKLQTALQAGAKSGAWAAEQGIVGTLQSLGQMKEESFERAIDALVQTTATEWRVAHDLATSADLYKGMLRGFSGTNFIRNAFSIVPALIAAA